MNNHEEYKLIIDIINNLKIDKQGDYIISKKYRKKLFPNYPHINIFEKLASIGNTIKEHPEFFELYGLTVGDYPSHILYNNKYVFFTQD